MPGQTIRGRSGIRKPLAAERRVHNRYACTNDIVFQPLANRKAGAWLPARVTNISSKGMGLVLNAAIERGAILSVKLEAVSQRFVQPLLVRVVRVVERSQGVWQAGCTFAVPLNEDDLSALLRAQDAFDASRDREQVPPRKEEERPAATHDPFINGSLLERRCVHRRHLSATVVVSYGSGFQETLEALALDGSVDGLKLLMHKPFCRGTILRVRPKKGAATVPSAEISVKSCRPQQTMWMINAQFVQPPPAEVMFALG